MLRNNPGWFSWFSWFWSCWWKVPLFRAVRYGYERVVRMLIAAGADVNVVERRGHTPLHVAAFIGHEGVARVLMEGGADVRAKDIDGEEPLHTAAFKGHEGVARLLLAGGAYVRAVCFRQRTPLHVAAFRGYGGMARLLKERGADVNAVNREQCTPLHYAAERGNEGVAKVLMEEGADVNAVNREQCTPLHYAAERGNEGVAKVLMEEGADVGAVNAKQQTPLQLAVVNKSSWLARKLKKTARVLVEGGAELVTCDSFSDGGGSGWAQGGSDSSGDGEAPAYKDYRKTTSANKEMDMALLGNESKVSREDLHAHYLFVYGENNEEILQLLQKLYDPEFLDNFKEEQEEQEKQEEEQKQKQKQKQEDSDYLAENKSKYDELVQELLEAKMGFSRGSEVPFSVPKFNEKTVDMSLPKDGARRQDPLMDPDADVPWMEPRLDLSSGEGRKDPEVTLENNLREASDGEDYIDVTSNFIGRLPGALFEAHQASMLALAMGVLSGVSGVPIIDGGVPPAVAA